MAKQIVDDDFCLVFRKSNTQELIGKIPQQLKLDMFVDEIKWKSLNAQSKDIMNYFLICIRKIFERASVADEFLNREISPPNII